jgi:pyruvate formate lyase activating enzyme
LIEEDRHLREVGLSNREILNNLRGLARRGYEIVIRVPIIPGCNDDRDNIHAIGAFLAGLGNRPAIELLAYHEAGEEKHLLLGETKQVLSVKPPGRERLMEIAGILRSYNLMVDIGA